MAVYVDELRDYGVTYGSAGPEWAHLYADTIEELHEFAALIGLQRRWFQRPPKHPHYDVTRGMRFKAIRHGALEKDYRHLAGMVLQQRQTGQ